MSRTHAGVPAASGADYVWERATSPKLILTGRIGSPSWRPCHQMLLIRLQNTPGTAHPGPI